MVQMLVKLRRRARTIASGALAAMTVVLFATCVAAAELPADLMPCCRAMHHDCGETSVQASCCGGELQDARSLAATKPTTGPGPAAVLTTSLPMVCAPDMAERQPRIAVRSSGPPAVPSYVLISSFRI